MKRIRRIFLMVAVLGLWAAGAGAQQLALKSNLLYDATLTPNLGAELALGRHSTAHLGYGLNPWEFGRGRQAKHWSLDGEYRWWPCARFNGHFFGVQALGGQFNMARLHVGLPFYNWPSDLKERRYEGWNVGAGLVYGYQWILSRHWNLEAEVAAGYQHIKYDRYPCADCGTLEKSGRKNYFGLTKIGLSFVYLF